MALYMDQPGSDADGKSMAALGAESAAADRAAAEEGGFEADAEEMAKHVNELSDMRNEKMNEIRELAQSLTDVDGLGDEPVSREYLEAVNASGESYNKFLNDMEEFLKSYIKELQNTVKEYRAAEQEAAAHIDSLAVDVE